MFDNNVYNLMAQMVEEHKSLWRINEAYIRDAGGCSQCKEFWQNLAKDKEGHIRDLTNLIKNHLK